MRRPVVGLLARREQDRPLAETLDRLRVVRDEEDRAALVLEGRDDAEALALEVLVADREDLVEQQHVGLQERGDREAEPHRHPARVRAHGPVDRVLDLGERDDLVEALADLGAAQALDRAVQVDVLAAAEVRVEAGAELEQRADAAVDAAPCPSVGLMIPASTRRSVDLPEPLRPISPTASPGAISADTSRSAQTSSPPVRPRATTRSLSVRVSRAWTRKRRETPSAEIAPGFTALTALAGARLVDERREPRQRVRDRRRGRHRGRG